jgi:hypothetical protein
MGPFYNLNAEKEEVAGQEEDLPVSTSGISLLVSIL